MNEWLKNFQSSYGALANNPSPRPTGPKSSWMTGVKGKQGAAASAVKAAAPKAGMKIKDWGPDQWGALASALSPLMEMMQKRRRR
tara:strand:- start:1386 stop:1640 length:255 start_codon:yes stop_codon:yes gene_type:complete